MKTKSDSEAFYLWNTKVNDFDAKKFDWTGCERDWFVEEVTEDVSDV